MESGSNSKGSSRSYWKDIFEQWNSGQGLLWEEIRRKQKQWLDAFLSKQDPSAAGEKSDDQYTHWSAMWQEMFARFSPEKIWNKNAEIFERFRKSMESYLDLSKIKDGKVDYEYNVKILNLKEIGDIAYTDDGNPEGKVLLFIHGLGSGIPVWDKNISSLKENYRCIAVDLPGHGYSCKAEHPYTVQFYAESIIAFMKQLDISKATLIGHSLGALIAVKVALKEAALVEKLVLVSPAGLEPYSMPEKQLILNLNASSSAHGSAHLMNRFNILLGMNFNKELSDEYSSKLRVFNEDAMAFGSTKIKSITGLLLEAAYDELQDIKQETLLMVGDKEFVNPFQFFRMKKYANVIAEQGKKIRSHKLITLAAGHFLQYQKPDEFNKAVANFVSQPLNANS